MRIAVAGGSGTVGRHVVEQARCLGHEVVALGRRTGVDVRSGHGLEAALEGVATIIDVLNIETTSRRKAVEFFTATTANLGKAGAARGVGCLLTLSIVGIDRAPGFGYYHAKLVQEDAARASPLPATIVRATQFHEFSLQMLSRGRAGPLALVPRMATQPVAARALGERLVELAAAGARVAEVEIAGPERTDLVELARRVVRRNGKRLAVVPVWLPGEAGRAMRGGALVGSARAEIVGPTIAEWLASSDSLRAT